MNQSKSAIAIFGGSFNPPGLHHRQLAVTLLARFERVLAVPCGYRQDKMDAAEGKLAWLESGLRRRSIEATFAGLPGLEIDWSDLGNPAFTPTIDLAARYHDRGELWFVAGADLFAGGAAGLSQIQRTWREGPRIWRELSWALECFHTNAIRIK